MQLVGAPGNVMVHRFGWPGAEKTTGPYVAGRPVSLSVAVPPCEMEAVAPPLTLIENDVAIGGCIAALMLGVVTPSVTVTSSAAAKSALPLYHWVAKCWKMPPAQNPCELNRTSERAPGTPSST